MWRAIKLLIIIVECAVTSTVPALMYELIKAEGVNIFTMCLVVIITSLWLLGCLVIFNSLNSRLNEFSFALAYGDDEEELK